MTGSSSCHQGDQHNTSVTYSSHYDSEDEDEEICVDDEDRSTFTADVTTTQSPRCDDVTAQSDDVTTEPHTVHQPAAETEQPSTTPGK